jgi:aspartate/methionine/tyrosine aminotransferase
VFSKRLTWGDQTNSLTQLRQQLARTGAQILDLTESNPTHVGLDYPADLLSYLSDRSALLYDPDPRGLESARQAVRSYYEAHGADVPLDRILLTASTSEAYTYLFKLLADPGDQILVPRPSYPLFEFLAALEAVEVRQYPLRYDGTWHVDFSELEKRITTRTRAIVVVNPNNPTGSLLKRKELERLEILCAERDLALVSDEVFCDYPLDADESSIKTLAGPRKALTFSMSGLSKVIGMPQLKLGWIAVSGPSSVEACERLEWIADTFLSVATPVQVALPKLLEGGMAVQRQIAARTRGNLQWLQHRLKQTPLNLLPVEGGWNGVVQVPRTRTEEEWVLDLLRTHHVLVQPGFFYDFESEAFLVVSLLTPAPAFREGVERLLMMA